MRPQQQQGRRSRNRGGGRRNQNPLQRSYESNGPDVKIRGNAQVVADKYATLARDALSSGDTVMAENYLQHAEHYNRIILAAQPQQRDGEDGQDAQASGDNGQDRQADNRQGKGGDRQQSGRRNRDNRDRGNDGAGQAQGEQAASGNGAADASEQPQPVIEGTPAEVRQEEAAQPAEQAEKPKRAPRSRKDAKNDEAKAAGDSGNAEQTADQSPANGHDDAEKPVAAE